ncbi:MAG: LptF/LptG family permease [Treponema sp.]|nr:LptF/LptG family permease [Treponema sp.]
MRGRHVLIKYILKELFLYFTIAFVFFFMVFFVNQILLIAESLLKSKVPLKDVMRLLVCYFPSIIAQSAPYATFVGFLMCLGRMMTDNEILVFRASGFAYRYLAIPVVVLGLVISIVSFIVNDYFLPLGSINATRISKEIFSATPSVELESNSIKNMNGSKIAIGEVKDRDISDIVFFQRDSSGNDRLIIAQDSEVLDEKVDGLMMQIQMENPVIVSFKSHTNGDYEVLDSDAVRFNVFDTSVKSSSQTSLNPDQMTSLDLGREIKKLKTEGRTEKRIMNAYKMIYNRKFSIPFASVFFAVLSISLALMFGKHNGQTIGLILGLIICVLNWAMLIMGQLFSTRNGFDGFWAMWIPNILLGGVGIILYLSILKK